ncbi:MULTISPECIES: VanZ family protein [Olivibacter]|jgi:VanZ family protein|uniref:VanZ family protein n=3 Tax=Sphingobacteriaceae TaxID=84566 RepID=F4CCG0_SPHS2|nr:MULTISPECIES: VanZ family protein [Olivibacter]MDM8176498.1 VanZ family protein [Olivibacter sp. 47]MDX3916047.1 VanZ family protein [Pseudosphingobacterium sp.]QEL00758.1 VanZ family protein [Olivibacter sp. LS-1]
MKHFIWAILWAVVVLLLTCLPMDNTTEKVPHFEGMDKLVHTGFFFVFSVLLCLGYARKKKTHQPQFGIFLKALIFSAIFALLTEFLQYQFFTYRSGDWWDVFADMTGTGMGLFSYLVLHRSYRAAKI